MADTTARSVVPDLKMVDLGDGTFAAAVSFAGGAAEPTGRSATQVVSASDAAAISISQADRTADGTADDVQIQAAIDALPT